MTEWLAAVSRFLATGGAAVVVGLAVFVFGCIRPSQHRPRVARALVILAITVCVGHAGVLVFQLQALADAGTGPVGWKVFVADTHVGRVWFWRAGVALAVLTIASAFPLKDLHKATGAAALAAVYLAMGPWGGHASGAEDIGVVMPVNILHVLAISTWMGALPAWFWCVRRHLRVADEGARDWAGLAQTLGRFSQLAIVLMAVIVVSGVWLADIYIDDEGDLLGTRYGLLVVGKSILLLGVLYLANGLRQRFLPRLRAPAPTVQCGRQALRHVAIEMALAACILACAAWLAQTTPALHEPQPWWWLPFRWSFDATWAEPLYRNWIQAGAGVAAVGLVMAVLAGSRSLRRWGAALAVVGAAGLSWALAVRAYPGTFMRAQVPYLTLSVANGAALYRQHCTSCHGDGGLGDGPLASGLPKPPANLSEPHTALHTAGDMFWWLTHGIPESGMPPFSAAMSEEERWDLINFLRAFSQGFESRVLRDKVVPGQAWIGAINFYLEGAKGPGELKGYRRTHNVLLSFLDGSPASRERALALAAAYPALQARRTAVIAVAIGAGGLPADLPYPVIRAGGEEIWTAYQLLSRTIANRGSSDRIGMEWRQAEFLIDRFGYIRARWIPDEDARGWREWANLHRSLDALNAEPQLKPFPDDHIH